jgi:hypothetical protein
MPYRVVSERRQFRLVGFWLLLFGLTTFLACFEPNNALAAGFSDTFDGTATGSLPSGWTVSGAVSVQEFPSASDKSLRLQDTSTSGIVWARKSFGTTGQTVTVEYKVRAAQTTETSGLSLRDSSGTLAVTVALDSTGDFYTYYGANLTTLQTYSANRWYNVKLIARSADDKFDLYIDGVKRVHNQPFRNSVGDLSEIYLNSSSATTGTHYYDFIKTEYADTPSVSYSQIGTVKARSASSIGGSTWSIGAETLDRDYAIYNNYKSYLGPLGAKSVRLQGGWAKTEKTQGVYSWAWLDEVVNDAYAQGVIPWLETSYGNTIYSGGGGTGLGGGLPTSAEALAAWDNWVEALVTRYKSKVTEWEVWNEPDIGGITATAYADFFIRTATIIRAVDPNAKIYALALASINSTYADGFLSRLSSQGKLGLVTAITYHGYIVNPDSHYGSVQSLKNTIANYSSTITVRQGENGAPSTNTTFGALNNQGFTETKQAKWDLRRMMGDKGRDIPTNVFTLINLQYDTGLNTKGLLATNSDKTVDYPKPAYYAVQNVTAIFDDTLTRIGSYAYTENTANAIQVYGYRKSGTNRQVVAVWFSGSAASDSNTTSPVTLTFSSGNFADPVYVDLRTGFIYEIPDGSWSVSGSSYTFSNIPVYDSPILIADKSVVLS